MICRHTLIPALIFSVTPVFAAEKSAAVLPSAAGEYRDQHCADGKHTCDIRLPKGYDSHAAVGYPAVFISGPQGRPGFRGLESWADDEQVVLITINESKNGDWADIIKAQEAVYASISSLRLHPTLRFTTGFSGGGWASVKLAQRHPKDFTGLVLQCHSGNGDVPPPACSIGLIGGLKDDTHPDSAVAEAASAGRKAGRYVQEEHLPMGHGWAPTPVVARMFTNMLLHARMTRPGPLPAERKLAAELPDKILAAARAESDPAKTCAALSPLLDIDEFKSKPFRAKALDLWIDAKLRVLEPLPATEAFSAYVENDTAARLACASGKSKNTAEAFRKKLENDPATKPEFTAWAEFVKLRDGYDREKRAKGAKFNTKDWNTRLAAFSKKHPGTRAAKQADALSGK